MFFYLVMDILIHWGVFRHMRHEIGARGWVLLTAIALDAIILLIFSGLKFRYDPLIVILGFPVIATVFVLESYYLVYRSPNRNDGVNRPDKSHTRH